MDVFYTNVYVKMQSHTNTHTTCTDRVISQHGAHLHVAADGQAAAGLQTATRAHPRLVSRDMLGELRLLASNM